MRLLGRWAHAVGERGVSGEDIMKVGDLAKIVWTEGCSAPVVVGVIASFGVPFRQPQNIDRQRVELFSNGKCTWFERGDLEVISESR